MIKISDKQNMKMGVLLSYFALVVSILCTIFITNRVVKYIGDYDYGLYSFVSSITVWLTVITTALNASFIRFATREAENNNGNCTRVNSVYLKLLILLGIIILIIGSSIFCICYLGDISFAKYDNQECKKIYILLLLSVINIAISTPSSIFLLYINYKKQFVLSKSVALSTNILLHVGHLLIAYYTSNIVYIALYSIFLTFYELILYSYFAKKHFSQKFDDSLLKENTELVKEIALFSGIIVFNAIVDQLNSAVDRTLLGIFSNPKNVTIYQLGQQFDVYLVQMSVAISGIFVPHIHEYVVRKKRDELNELFLFVSKAQLFVVSLITFGFATCGKSFVILWMGEERAGIYYVAIVLMAIDLCPLSINSSIEIQRAMNRHKFRALVYLAVALLNVGLSILFIYIFPEGNEIFACLLGSIIGRILSHWVAMNIYNYKVIMLPIKGYIRNLILYITIGGLSCFIVKMLQLLLGDFTSSHLIKLVVSGIMFVFVYLILSFSFDRSFIKTITKKISFRCN